MQFNKEFEDALTLGKRLAIQVNPKPYVTHKFNVVKGVRLLDSSAPKDTDANSWHALLDRWDADTSTGLGRGVIYIAGDVIEVDRFEAADLITALPGFFEPADELTAKLKTAIERGEVGE